MGREMKRVPVGFDWPINTVWEGYLNPFYEHSTDCAHCAGSGSSPEALRLKGQWYGNTPFKPEDRGSIPFRRDHPAVRALAERNVRQSPRFYGSGELAVAREAQRLADHFNRGWQHHLNTDDVAALIDGGRLMDLTHTWTKGEGWQKKQPEYIPSPNEVNEWSLLGFGHDSINQWCVVNAECKRLGIASECEHCNGDGSVWSPPEAKQQADDWQRIEPPSGDGYQMWETTSEGSPISPVFAQPRQLAEWLAENRGGTIDDETTAEQWLEFIQGPRWAPTLIIDSSGVHTGVASLAQ